MPGGLVEEIRQLVGADSLHHLSEDGLKRALGDDPPVWPALQGNTQAKLQGLTYRQSGVDIDG